MVFHAALSALQSFIAQSPTNFALYFCLLFALARPFSIVFCMPAPSDQPPKSSLDANDDEDLEDHPTERRIQLAVTAVQTKVLSERGAEIYYRVPRTTIQNRIEGMVSRQEAHAVWRSLSKPQEEVLVEWTKVWTLTNLLQLSDTLKGLAKRGIPLSLTIIDAYAADIYGAPLGVTWPVRFKKRHPDLKIKGTTKLEACRAQALNRPVVHDYFTLLSETIETYEIQSKNIWNMRSHCTFRFIDFAKQHAQNIVIDKYNLLAHYAIVRDQAFKKTTIISAFRKCGIWLLDETAIPDSAVEPARNYTTQASMPVAPRLPSILVPVSTSESSTSTLSTEPPDTASTVSASELDSTPASTHSADATNTSSANQPRPSTPIASMPTDALRAAYKIAMPSPLRKTASRNALAAENDELRNLLKAAGIELEINVAQMALMQRENANIRQQLHAKKNKQKRLYTTGRAHLMTGAEMHAVLLKELQKKQMGELHSEWKKKIFPAIQKEISEAEKVAKAAKKQREREAKAAQKEMERGAKAAARARGRGQRATRGRGRGRGRGCERGRGRGAIVGCGRSRDSDCEDEFGESADEETDLDERNASPSATSSDEESNADEPFMGTDHGHSSNNAFCVVQGESDGDSEEETGINSFNGHRWESRRNLQFQVLWTDGDVTWEPLFNVNDCAAMENYLAHCDVDDPLRLSKRKFR
ncbi:hypothetical protein K438DRAFT_1981677 [Mycena galopus ATCC 62051]|nr:hypothetical protein K438DRAFT_1981677 [Mycena galopus ATCC 62051]